VYVPKHVQPRFSQQQQGPHPVVFCFRLIFPCSRDPSGSHTAASRRADERARAKVKPTASSQTFSILSWHLTSRSHRFCRDRRPLFGTSSHSQVSIHPSQSGDVAKHCKRSERPILKNGIHRQQHQPPVWTLKVWKGRMIKT